LPVVILTTSDAERDMAMAYEYHANSYVTKPVNFLQTDAEHIKLWKEPLENWAKGK